MKCRRKNFRKHVTPSVEHYWDRNQQAVVAVPGRPRSGASMKRRMRRHGFTNIERARSMRSHRDNYIDKLVSLERDHEGQVERVGDKFKILDNEQETG